MRQVFTEKLSDVVHMLQLARKTGCLSVEHMGGKHFYEQGSIYFVNGQITQATTGVDYGARALEELQTWEDCHFAFYPDAIHVQEDRKKSNGVYKELSAQPVASRQEHSKKSNGTHRESPPALPVAPYRLQEIDQERFSRMNLSRIHWHLFLLVDGQRSTLQLARLLGRGIQETNALLFELERAHLIQR